MLTLLLIPTALLVCQQQGSNNDMNINKFSNISINILLPLCLISCANKAAKYGTVLDAIKPELKQSFNPEKIRSINKLPTSIANLLIPKINNI